jgi:Fic family protein
MQKNKSYEEILKRLEEKKQKLDGKLRPFDRDFLYPSFSSGAMAEIDRSSIKYIEELANKIKKENLSLNDIKEINRKISSEFSYEFRKVGEDVYINCSEPVLVPTGLELYVNKFPEKFIEWFNSYKGYTVEVAAIAHVKFVAMHPFWDGNGRTAHLLMNLILLQDGYPVTMVDDFSNYAQKLCEVSSNNNYFKILEPDFSDENLENFCIFVCEIVEKSLDLSLKNI